MQKQTTGKLNIGVGLIVMAGIAVGSILWTANLGGKIRHTEIGNNSAQTVNPVQQTETQHRTEEEDDNDH